MNNQPLAYFICNSISKIIARIRGNIYARFLKTSGLYVGKICILKGLKNISIGRNVFMNDGFWIEAIDKFQGQSFTPTISIGNYVSFSRNVHIGCINKIVIGNNVLFGSNVYITDHNHGCYSGDSQSLPDEAPALRRLSTNGPVMIDDNVWIGDNVTILAGSFIGSGAIVAANTVVKGNVLCNTIVAGNPCKVLKEFDYDSSTWKKK